MVLEQGGVTGWSARALGVCRAAGKLAGDKVPWQRRKALGTGKLQRGGTKEREQTHKWLTYLMKA